MEVINENFEECFEEIRTHLEKAAFIAVDMEFSGLLSVENLRNSLFDNIETRYCKLRQNTEHVKAIQFGLSIFKYNGRENKYVAFVYRFYICPRPFVFDDLFYFQASSVDFLCRNGFEFDKFMYQGLSYMNRQQYLYCVDLAKCGNLSKYFENTGEKFILQAECLRISTWITSSSEANTYHLNPKWDPYKKVIMNLILQQTIRMLHPNVWTTDHPDGGILVEKVTPEMRESLLKNSKNLDEEIIDAFHGFSRIFELLVEARVPMIGHNMLTDLIKMYSQFFWPLPRKCKEFKEKLSGLFPCIYDTKHISYQINVRYRNKFSWNGNALNELYLFLNQDSPVGISMSCCPSVIMGNGNIDEIRFHDAAYDSYCAGFCFIRLAHVYVVLQRGSHVIDQLTNIEYFSTIKPFRNRINLIRANTPYIYLEGKDPEPSKPVLHIRDKFSTHIDIKALKGSLAKYGNIDFCKWSEDSIVIAVPNYPCARNILNDFAQNKRYKIVYHNPRSTIYMKSAIWGGCILSGILFSVLIYKKLKT